MNNYLLFHCISELFSVSVAWCVFALTWSTRIHHRKSGGFFLLIGISSLFVGGLDMMHILTYKGMQVISGYDANLPTQLWICARYLQSLSFMAAAGLLFLKKPEETNHRPPVSPYRLLTGYALITAILLISVFSRDFPVCFVEGSGLTPFKRISEYTICIILSVSAVLLWQGRKHLDREMFKALMTAFAVSILTEISFALYSDVYGLFNFIGHILKIIVFIFLYRAIVQIGINKPFTLLARDLRDSELRYRTIVENTNDALFIQNFKGIITDVNENACRMLGYGRDELLGKNISMIRKVNECPSASEQLIIAGMKDSSLMESEMLCKDGSSLPIESSICVVSHEGDGILQSFVRNISKRKRAESELREREKQFRTIFEVATVGIVQADPGTGRILRCNETYCRITGYSESELMDIHFPDITHPDDRQKDREIFNRAARGEIPTYYNEKRYVRKDGKTIWVRLNAAFIRNMNGEAFQTVAVCEDITERKRSEEQLIELSQRLTYHVDNSPLAVIEWGPDMRLIRWSRMAESIFGWKAEEVLHKRMEEFHWIHEDDMGQVEDVSRELITGSDVRRFSFNRNFRKDGSVRYCEWYNSSLLDDSGKLLSILSLALDVTDRKTAEDRLEASLREKEILLKEIHHRVKNNLQIISSLISLQTDGMADAKLIGALNDVRDRIRAIAIVHERLYQTDDLAKLDFAEYADSLLSYVWNAHASDMDHVRLVTSLAQVPFPVDTAVQCGLILNELITNAIKHAFTGIDDGEIVVSLEYDPNTNAVCLSVKDNGVGLPADVHRDWEQAPSLGLRLVQALTGQLQGLVQIGEGPGAEIRIRFNIK